MEDFKDTVNQMLKDVLETHCLALMSDYPQVMVGIHEQILDNLTSEGRLIRDLSTNRLLVDSHFVVEELEVIQKGYDLLAEKEAEEEAEGRAIAGWSRW